MATERANNGMDRILDKLDEISDRLGDACARLEVLWSKSEATADHDRRITSLEVTVHEQDKRLASYSKAAFTILGIAIAAAGLVLSALGHK